MSIRSGRRRRDRLRSALAVAALAGLALAPAAASAEQTCPSLAGVEGFGLGNQGVWEVAVQGQYAYTADYYGFTVYDVSDQQRPRKVSQLQLADFGAAVAVSGSFAYVADDERWLSVIDISEPEAPVVVGTMRLAWTPFDMILDPEAQMLYVTSVLDPLSGRDSAYLKLVDVSDPEHPVGRGWIGNPDGYLPLSDAVQVAPRLVYATDWSRRFLRVVDVSDPDDPSLITSVEGALKGMVKVGSFLYGASAHGLVVVDVSDPTAPIVLAEIKGLEYRNAILCGGRLLTTTHDGVDVLDLTDPTAPELVAEVPFVGADELSGFGAVVVVQGSWGSLLVVDATDPGAPVAASGLDLSGSAEQILADGTLLFIGNGPTVEVVDVSDPQRPVRRGRYDTGGDVWHLARNGELLYVFAGGPEGDIVDVSDPDEPTLVGHFPFASGFFGMAVAGDTAYLGEGYRLEIVDLSDPLHPIQVSRESHLAEEVFAAGSMLYVFRQRMEMSWTHIDAYDITDPHHPVLVRSAYDEDKFVYGLAPAGSYLVTWTSDRALEVLDSELSVVGSVRLPFYGHTVEVQGTMAVVGSWGGEALAFVDIADPRNPEVVATLPNLRYVLDVAIVRPSSTVWTASGAIVEGVRADCASCAGMRVSASDRLLEAGGETTTVTAKVVDLSGKPVPGQEVVGTATAGTVGDFVDRGDGSYTAEYTSGPGPAIAEVAVSVNGEACPRTVEIVVHQPPHRRGDNVSEEIDGSERSGP